MLNWLKNFATNEIAARIMSWQTTIPGAFLAVVTSVCSTFIAPEDLHSFAGQVAQYLIYGASLALVAWKDRKNPT